MEEVAVEVNPIDEAKKLLEADRVNRIKQASAEINEILNKYNVSIISVIQIRAKD